MSAQETVLAESAIPVTEPALPVAEVAQLGSTVRARKSYEAAKENQRPYL